MGKIVDKKLHRDKELAKKIVADAINEKRIKLGITDPELMRGAMISRDQMAKLKKGTISREPAERCMEYMGVNKELFLNHLSLLQKERKNAGMPMFNIENEDKENNMLSGDVAEEVLLDLIDANDKYLEEVKVLSSEYRELISKLESIAPMMETMMEKFKGFDERLINIEVVMDALSYYSSHSRKNGGEA